MMPGTSRFGSLLQRSLQQLQNERGRRVSVSNFSKEAGIDRSYYYKLLRDPNLQPSRELVTRIAQVLNVPVDDFLLAAGYAPDRLHRPVEHIGTAEVERLFSQYSDRVEMPFYGEVGCGAALNIGEHYSETRLVPRHLARRGDSVVRASGDSMDQAGIFTNSLLVVKHQRYAQNRQIVVANVQDYGCTCKRYVERGGQSFLSPESSVPEYYDIPVNQDVNIVGVVKASWYEREFN